MNSDNVIEKARASANQKGEGTLRPTAVRKRAAARLAAIQLGYELEMTGRDILEAMPEFLTHYAEDIARQLKVKKLDEGHFQLLTMGVHAKVASLDQMIDEVLDEGWSRERLARHDICILRAGICELQDMPHIPVRAVLSEYAGMAEVFQSDVAFINAVMDRHAHTLRTEELAAQK